MYFSKKLYVSDNFENSFEIREKISNNKKVSGVYLICISNDNKNTAEIMCCNELFSEHNKNKFFKIIGLAQSKNDAYKLLLKIMQDFINDGNHLEEFKKYFK